MTLVLRKLRSLLPGLAFTVREQSNPMNDMQKKINLNISVSNLCSAKDLLFGTQN